MGWDEVKHAINRTLGESEFKPLNQIITDAFTSLNSAISAVQTEVAKSDTANASGTLSQKIRYTNSTLIGAANATKGTATTGTVMGKLRALIEDGAYSKMRDFTSLTSVSLTSSVTITTTKIGLVMCYYSALSGSGHSRPVVKNSVSGSGDGGEYMALNFAGNYTSSGTIGTNGGVIYLLPAGTYRVYNSYSTGDTGTLQIKVAYLT